MLSHARDGVVELHPTLLAAILGDPIDTVEAAILRLCAPDPKSRNPAEDGRRLLHLEAHMYRVVSWDVYVGIRKKEDRREYLTVKKRESRERAKVRGAHAAGTT